MSSTTGPKPNPYGRSLRELLSGSRGFGGFKAIGDAGGLAVTTARLALTAPFPWVRDAFVQGSLAFTRCVVPLMLSHAVYLIGFGLVLFGAVVSNLGLTEREASFMFIIWSREIATWITAMIFAGIVGSAITADLGAMRIREELDALSVLGVEQKRALVVPRVVAATIAMPVLAMLSLAFINVVNLALAPGHLGVSLDVFLNGLSAIIQPNELYFTVFLKNLIIGFFVGVIACWKGLSCGLGAEGVGRAVNQSVVITFFGIWLFNSFFNIAYFTTFPDLLVLRG